MLRGEAWVNSRQRQARDKILAAALVPPFAPLTLASMGLIRVLNGPDTIFRQPRLGKAGDTFNIYKLRTMPIDTAASPSKGAFDNRATRFGRLLRVTGIDETPQLLNILRGELKIFGPRALLETEIDQMQTDLPRALFNDWLEVYKTGPGCISSFSHAAHSEFDPAKKFKERAVSDINDFENASPINDMFLLGRAATTAASVIKHITRSR